MATQSSHLWNFSTIGGVKRVNLETGADLLHLDELDPKLWTALSCPVKGLEIDHKTLELIDADKDGQIRAPEIIAAVKWITSVIKTPDVLLKPEENFQLSYINEQTELGKILLASAKIILKNIGKEHANSMTVEDTSDTEKIFSASIFNGDGIITENTTNDESLKKIIQEMISTLGSVTDRGGQEGIHTELLNQFFETCQKYQLWISKKESNLSSILPFGDRTEEAYLIFHQIKSKIDDYFLRCRLAQFDPIASNPLNIQVAQVEAISSKNLSLNLDEIASYPLAHIEAGKALPLNHEINPAWEKTIVLFKSLVVEILFPSKPSLTESDWKKINESFDPYIQWISEKEGQEVESLGIERIREILSGSEKEKLEQLIEQDKALETEANNMILVDQLVRYHRDIFQLLKNFVTFYDFYSPGSKAIFQAGTLYIDQRSCDLCIKVSDMSKHANMVAYSGMYLMYCECKSRTTEEKMMIVAALTNGDIDNLVVGRNALFFDRQGQDWDATIVKIIDNPISIRQAFFSPYRKLSAFIEKQINKFASSEEEKISGDMTKSIEALPGKMEDNKAKKESAPPFDIGKFVGIFAAIGLAIGAIGSVLASIISGFLNLELWKMPFAIIGIILLISGPSMIMAYLKLRQRNLAPILDANGWAINARVTVNIQFGNLLTQLAELPKGSKVNLNDPFMKKKFPLFPVIIILIAITAIVLYFLWKQGIIHISM